jgi:electron transfer flavoprotein beta subunit
LKILVCMKQVPQKDAPLKLNEAGNWIRDEVPYEVNEPDAFALEEALRQREKHTGEVVVITSGPARAQQVLREALAKGADRAIHLEDNAFVGLDAFNTAKAFAAACNPTTTATPKPASSWQNCWAGRTPPSSWRSKKRMSESA